MNMETFGGLTREQIRWDAEHQPDHLTNCAAAMVALLDALERAERERNANKEDAERYRWLRDNRIEAQAMFWNYESRKQRDAAIDAERERE